MSLCAAKKPLEVVGALIEDSDTYLVGQRAASKSQGGFWEFIGGKIEADETPEQAFDWLKYSPFSEAKPLEYVLFCGYGGEAHIDANEFGLRGAENIINSGDPIRALPSHWGQPTSGKGGHPFINYVRNAEGN